jgi:arginine-tRNA-protein transferase
VDPIVTFITPLERCEYLPDREWQLQYEIVAHLTVAEYQARLDAGWRRFGHALFRPACPSCRMCESLRIPVLSFAPNRSQRRAWRANADAVSLRIGEPAWSPEKDSLRQKFQEHQHHRKGWPEDTADYEEMLVHNPVPTEEWCYYVDDRLIGVGYVDCVSSGLSAIYFFYDPDERQRSLGTFNVLSILAEARTRGLPYVYLGYYVKGCQSLEYKANFTPHERLRDGGAWR